MSTETDKELADRLDAKKRLEGHGYTQHTCLRCKGTGINIHVTSAPPCYYCNGKGYTWEAPFTRLKS